MPGAAKRTATPRKAKFLHKPTCTTCRKARALLEKEGVALELRDLGKERMTVRELDQLIGDRDYRQFLNPRNELYRRRKMGRKPPARAVALRLMAAEPNLIRRPAVIRGGQIVLGFDEVALHRLAGRG
jgi:arsenate reductase-like glutaredoxin family protein